MTNASLFRTGGLALLAGAIVFAIHVMLRSVVTAGPDPAVVARAGSWVPINLLGLAGATLVLLGLPAVYPRIVASGGRSGTIGLALLAASWMFFGLFLSLYGALVMPWLAEKAPSLVALGAPPPPIFVIAFAIALLGWLVGASLVAIPFLRHRANPTWVGYAIPLSAAWMVIGNLVIAPRGPAANFALNLLSNMGPVVLLAALGYLGYRVWSEHSRVRV